MVKDSRNPQDWILKANEDLKVAIILAGKGNFGYHIGFFCQQAAEKTLKGYLLTKGSYYPKTHDLTLLLRLSIKHHSDFKVLLENCLLLNPLYVEERYPFGPPIKFTKEKIARILKACEEILKFVKQKTSL